MSRAAAAKSKDQISQKEKDQCIAVLEELLKVPGNDICADCSAKGPRWASVNIGVFVCIRCSGIHRNLGVHISKVKSVTLDFWTYDLVEVMRRVGNKRANSVFEANLPPTFRKPTESDNNYGVEQFIRDKYDRKKWYNPAAASQPVAAQAPVETKKHRTEEDEQRRRERREQRRREKQQQQLLQQQQQQQPQQPVQSNNNNFFADFSTPQNSKQSLINFGDFQSFSTPSQPQSQPQPQQSQPQPQPQTQSVPQPQPTQPQSSAFANSNAEFFGTVDTKAKEKEDILALFRTPAAQAYPQNTGFPTNQAYGYNQFQGGFQSNGYQGNNGGFQPNGFQSGGFQSNGFQGNNGGFQPNGFQPNGFQSSGFQSNGFQSNGFQSNGYQQPNNANNGFGNNFGNNFGFVSPNQASGNNSFQF